MSILSDWPRRLTLAIFDLLFRCHLWSGYAVSCSRLLCVRDKGHGRIVALREDVEAWLDGTMIGPWRLTGGPPYPRWYIRVSRLSDLAMLRMAYPDLELVLT